MENAGRVSFSVNGLDGDREGKAVTPGGGSIDI